MVNSSPFPQFDPSKMDPKVLMELSQLIQKLPPEKLSQMQSIMHNMMAGFDVKNDLELLEKTFPPGFREKLMSIMMSSGANPFASSDTSEIEEAQVVSPTSSSSFDSSDESQAQMDVRQARLTLLRAVADGRMTPEQAEKLL